MLTVSLGLSIGSRFLEKAKQRLCQSFIVLLDCLFKPTCGGYLLLSDNKLIRVFQK